MAQSDFEEKLEIEKFHIESTDVMTGDRNKNRFLLYQLKLSMAQAKQIDIIVAFLMESGVRMLLKDLKAALNRGVQIRILTGNYLGITQPSALFLIKKELGNKVELRFYNDKERSFHPKSYIFHYENMSEIYIGSSNISRSALTSGIEWNYRFNSKQDSQNFNLFYETIVAKLRKVNISKVNFCFSLMIFFTALRNNGKLSFFFLKRNIDSNFKNCIISLTEPTTPLIFMRNPVGLSYL